MSKEDNMPIDVELQENYQRYGTVLLFGDINPKKAELIRYWLMRLALQHDGDHIKLIIDSPGGSVPHALMLVDLIQSLPKPVVGVVNGECNSMAPVVLQACQRRIATKHSRFLLHNISNNARYSLFDASARFNADYKLLQEYQEQIIEILRDKSGLSREKVVELITGGDVVTETHSAQTMLGFKLIDEVVDKFEMVRPHQENNISQKPQPKKKPRAKLES